MKTYLLECLMIVTALLMAAMPLRGSTNYVDWQATGTNGGTSWQDAYTNLPFALGRAVAGDQIWVAYGTYMPTNGTNRSASITLKNNVSVYGGFTNDMTSLSQRDWTVYPTILSGDIQSDGIQTNNSYHVVSGATNVVFDGFVVTGGCANAGAAPNDRGGGMYCVTGPNLNVANCVFAGNYGMYGAGVYLGDFVTFSNCMFSGNTVHWFGGGLAVYGSGVSADGCQFVNNSADLPTALGAGVFFNSGGSVTSTFHNCSFALNRTTNVSYGAALNIYASTASLILDGCNFIGNQAANDGGAVTHSGTGTILATNCVFSGNSVTTASGFGGALRCNRTMRLADCVFCDNAVGSNGGGGAIYVVDGVALTIERCVFAGNEGPYGGAIRILTALLSARNCTFIGNHSIYWGGAIYTSVICTSQLANCTFAWNRAELNGGAVYASAAGTLLTLTNCIAWTNSAPSEREIWTAAGCTNRLSYTDIQGGWNGAGVGGSGVTIDDGGNLNTNPLFAVVVTGQWTAAAAFSTNIGQTCLENTNAAWSPGALAGQYLNPNTTQWRMFVVVTNTATNVTVWGDAPAIATNGAAYQICDFHEQSRVGRWTPMGWVTDVQHSPCIDAGDPAAAFDKEPRPNGGRINIGAYGNTDQASKSIIPAGTIFLMR